MAEITPNTPNPVREDAYKQQLAAKLGIDPQYIPGSPIWHSEEEIAAIAEMFSNMAGGGSSGGGVLIVDLTSGTSNETAEEMFNAFKSGMGVRFVTTNSSDNYFAEDCISCEYVEGYGYYFYYGINGDVYRLYNSTDHIELGGGGGDIG